MTSPEQLRVHAILAAAAEVEAAETRLKQEILAYARAGDCPAVIGIIERWLAGPPAEALAPKSA